MSRVKPSRFFCENCGVEVKADAKVCRACGRFFSAVRCPRCNFTDDARMFLYGCPKCGYAGGGESKRSSGGRTDVGTDGGDWEIIGAVDSIDLSDSRQFRASEIPGWVWYLAAGMLGVVFIVLVIVYLNL